MIRGSVGRSRKERVRAAEIMRKLLDYMLVLRRESKTSKTSLRAFTVKTSFVERWLNHRQGYPVAELLQRFYPSDELYVRRQLRRFESAGRINIVNGRIEPTEVILADLMNSAKQASLSVEAIDDSYVFAYEQNICWLVSRLSELSLLKNREPSLLNHLVELAVWEANLSGLNGPQVTSGWIERRLKISKSTLSCLLHKGDHPNLVVRVSEADNRKLLWGLSSDESIAFKRDAILWAANPRFSLETLRSRLIRNEPIRTAVS